MIRNLLKTVRNSGICTTTVSNVTIFTRFKQTEVFDERKESTNNEELKQERSAEVHLWHSTRRNFIDPAYLSEEQWQHLHGLESQKERKKFCKYLNFKINTKINKRNKKLEEMANKDENRQRIRAERTTNPHIVYGLFHNTLHLRINKQTINKWMKLKLGRTKLFGQKIVVDCSYEHCMTDEERSNVAKNLNVIYSENRKHTKPLDLHLCGVRGDSAIIKNLSGQIPALRQKESPMKIHSECFTELFPKEQLVMLTPDSEHVLEYSSEDVYIVGGIVDLGHSDPLTLTKAKELDLRTARLPLDNIKLRPGDCREITMPGVVRIIREYQMTNDLNAILKECNVFKLEWEERT